MSYWHRKSANYSLRCLYSLYGSGKPFYGYKHTNNPRPKTRTCCLLILPSEIYQISKD